MIEVEVPELGIVEFPDDTTPQVMEDTLSRHFKREELGQEMKQARVTGQFGKVNEKLIDAAERVAYTTSLMHPLKAIRPFVNPYGYSIVPPEAALTAIQSIGGPAEKGTALEGAQQFAAEMISGLGQMENIPAFAAGVPAVSRVLPPGSLPLVGRTFQTEMIGSMPQQIQQVQEAQTTPEAVKAGLGLTATAAMVGGIEHGISGKKGVENAIPVRSTEAIPVEVPPRSGEEVGTRVPEPEKASAAQAQEVPPVAQGTGGQAQGEVPLDPIVSAAFRKNGRIFDARDEGGVTHMEADMLAEKSGVHVTEKDAGFVTQSGKFLTREEAYEHAKKTNQVLTENDTFDQGKLHTGKMPPYSEAKPSLLPQETAPVAPAPEAALGESSKGVVEPTSATPPPATTTDKLIQSKEQVAETQPAIVQAKAQVKKTAITDGQRAAREVKSELVDRIEQAIEASKSDSPNKPISITIDIPGDGTFTVPNSTESLTALLARAKKISTSSTMGAPTKAPTFGIGDISEQADKVVAAYGSPEKAYQTAKRQRDALPDNDPETPAKAEAAEFLMRELYGRTKAGILDAKIEGAESIVRDAEQNASLYEREVEKLRNRPTKRKLTDRQQLDLNQMMATSERARQSLTGARKRLSALYDEKAALEKQSEIQVAQPEVVGMGGATAGEKPVSAQIEQLTEAFKGVESEKAPLIDRVKESFRIGENTAATKDALSKAVNGLKTAGDYIITKWRGIPNVDEFRRAEGELSGQLETRGWRVREWVKQARKAVPSKRTQAAIAKWVDSGGNRSALELGLAETKPEYKQAYQDALNLQGDLLTAAENIRNYFDSRLQEAVDAGVLKEGVEDYIHRIYESRPDVAQKAIARLQSGLLKPNPSLIKKRVFDYDWEAEKLGYRPVQSFVQRISAYEAALSKAIASREFIKKATTMKAADSRPVVDVKGVGIPIEEEGVREGTLIKPQFNPAKANDPGTENYRGDYVNKEFPSLSKWKWVSSDAAGKPIYVQGDVAIHPDYAPRITALLEPSRLRYGKYGKVIRPVLKASSTIKQTMLSLSGFHNVQILVHGMEHKVMPWKLVQKIDFADPNVDALLKGGVTLGGDFYGGYAPEGLFGTALTHKIPWLGPLAESYQTWLFQSFIPRMKLTMALNALERNRARFAGQMTDEQIAFKTAYEANSAFGELNYILLERSKTTQDMARLIMLAPDFLEARARFALEGFEKGGKSKVPGFGNEQRAALLLGAMTMYITARVANKILDDQYHFEPENMFSIVYKNHAYSLRTVQGDILHLLKQPLQFWLNRLNPGITRPLLQLGAGRDYFGRKRTPLETLADTAINMIPISLRSGRERTIWESLASSFGVNARRYNATDDAFKLAQKWKEAHGVTEPGEFIYDSTKDKLRPLKIALSSDDDVAAAAELKKLFDAGITRAYLNGYFKRYASMPFTGKKSNDRKWMETLNVDDRKTVEAAIEHKKAIRQLYWNALGIYDSRPEKP